MNFLSLFVLIPVLMTCAMFCTSNARTVRTVMMTGASMLLALAVALTVLFLGERASGNTAEMLYTADAVWYAPLNIHYSVGVDGISVAMLLLSSIIVFTGVLASWKMAVMPREYFAWFSLLSIGVFGFFISIDLFTMFLFYEVALIPMYLLIGVWGTGRKEYSAMKLTLMLMGGSALLLVGILGIYFHSAPEGGQLSMNILEISEHTIPMSAQYLFFPLTFVGFGVLGAMFPFHTWSPDGHASAPTAVSMLHAGVLSWIFLILTGTSVVYGALSAIKQTDLKYINAYSSVSHCGLVLFAILMLNQTAMTGAVLQMLSHGLMTALFFALIGMIYGRTHTRDIREMGGLMRVMPFLGVCFVIAGLYVLRMVGKLLYGAVQNPEHLKLTDATFSERFSVATLIVAIAGLGMVPLWVSDMISYSLIPVIEQLTR